MDFLDIVKILGLPAAILVPWASLKSRGHEQKKFEIERKDILVEKCQPIFEDEPPSKKQVMEIEAAFHSYSGVEARYELIAVIMRNPRRFLLTQRLKKSYGQFDWDERSKKIKRVSGNQIADSIKLSFSLLCYTAFSYLLWHQTTFELPDAISQAIQGEILNGEMVSVIVSFVLYLLSLTLFVATGKKVLSSYMLEKLFDPASFEEHPISRFFKTMKRARSKISKVSRSMLSSSPK
ncbi:hypothetical protein M8009_13025 [Halomonas sp. ATCH28]|uniref:Uncharacterized protein n=1 Tax=Halomonas gemina TaxID=2945105 RepID=A0ABT0T2R3_9GAMM|nr:hypothetical protein [Halomonas gemina]MCL7941209.1 hypothetical protein [Halomonas gemina]